MRLAALLFATTALLGPGAAFAADQASTPAASPPIAAPVVPILEPAPPEQNPELIDGRKRPGQQPTYPGGVVQTNPGAVNAPPPDAFPTDEIPVPDRWRLAA